MTAGSLLADIKAAAARWAKLVPALLWHDPIFRYATIAAIVALFFLIARLAQDFAGPGAIPSPEQTSQGSDGSEPVEENDDALGASASGEQPPVPGSATTPDPEDAPVMITPGRSLENIEVEPAPRDSFGTLPKGEPQK